MRLGASRPTEAETPHPSRLVVWTWAPPRSLRLPLPQISRDRPLGARPGQSGK